VVDHFTGYVWGETFATKEAEPVALFVYKIYLEYGFPQKIGYDNGREFVNKVMEGLQGYEHGPSAAYAERAWCMCHYLWAMRVMCH
jgi:hypothetical protein